MKNKKSLFELLTALEKINDELKPENLKRTVDRKAKQIFTPEHNARTQRLIDDALNEFKQAFC